MPTTKRKKIKGWPSRTQGGTIKRREEQNSRPKAKRGYVFNNEAAKNL